MPIFLTQQQIYKMLQRELPEGAYPGGPPSAYFSNSDMDSVANVGASGYQSLQKIYNNYFPQTSTEKIDDWVFKMFGTLFDASVPLQTKRDRVIAKIRSQPTINFWQILTTVVKYLPNGVFAQVYHACGAHQFWQLGVSLLGIDTILGGKQAADIGITDANIQNWCQFVSTLHWRLGQDGLGDTTFLSYINWVDLADFQATAFQYEIRIFGYQLSPTDLIAMDNEVSAIEPGRSSHIIRQNLNLNTFGLTTIVPNAGQFSGVDCIDNDPLSSTGYTGLTT